ncbi:CoA transferase [Microbacterium profundi]|uniref:CoA transferase n=1 Tax=Microbacterium profundi TaxID=450380 RepID=A0ABV3LKA7_9MICO|nr:CoA transferase [Microbacterium profundi]
MRLFEGIRVIEIGGGIAVNYATKLFGDCGAEVIKIEPPTGDLVRRMAPFVGNEPDDNGSAVFLHTNTSKKSVVLDLEQSDARDSLLKLVATADIVVEGLKPDALAAMGLGFDDLVKVQPTLVMTSITPFGQDGPYAQYEGSELIYYGMGGPLGGNGVEDDIPVKLGGYMSIYQTGNSAATATLAALLVAEGQNEPVHVDVSGFETGLSSSDRRTTFLLNYAYNGELTGRGNVLGGILPNGAFPTDDGYVQTVVTQAWLPRMLETIADDDLTAYFAKVAQDPSMFATMETKEAIDAALYPWLLQRTRQEAMEEAQRHKWPLTAIKTPTEVLEDPHYKMRGFFTEVTHPIGTVVHPGSPFNIEDGWNPSAAPRLGEHTVAVLAEFTS